MDMLKNCSFDPQRERPVTDANDLARAIVEGHTVVVLRTAFWIWGRAVFSLWPQ
jgi:hypothetical protein